MMEFVPFNLVLSSDTRVLIYVARPYKELWLLRHQRRHRADIDAGATIQAESC
jgi:hypothetical protein